MKIMSKAIYFLFIIALASCAPKTFVKDVEEHNYNMDEKQLADDPSVESILKPFRSKMDAQMNEVLIQNTATLSKGKPESTLGNLLSDLLVVMGEKYNKKKIDFAVQNYGGIRIGSVSRGPITLGKVYEVMPFDNYMVTLDIPGSVVEQLCQHMARGGGWPVSAGLRYKIEEGKAVDITLGGKPLDLSKTYTLATSDYVANGGDSSHFLKEYPMTSANVYVRDVIAEYLRDLDKTGVKLKIEKDGRVSLK